MTWHCEKFDWLGTIVEHHVICDATKSLIDIGLKNGGFVSGGFAKVVSNKIFRDLKILSPKDDDLRYRIWPSISHYAALGLEEHRRRHERTRKYAYATAEDQRDFDPLKLPRFMLTSRGGDIDVFFPTEEDAKVAIRQARNNRVCKWSTDTFAGNGHEFFAESGISSNLVQFISKFNGPPEEMLDTFDITNAKVYMDGEGIHWCDDWAEVEDKNELGISSTDRLNLIWRVGKWQRKHQFNRFKVGDDIKYADALISLAEKSFANNLVMWGKNVGIYTLRSHGKNVFNLMTPRALLTASMIYDSYDQKSILSRVIEKSNENRN